jgi:two-component system sensor histidine kinase YesM
MIRSFERQIMIQSVDFNFQLISNLVEQDLRNLSALAWWCSQNREIAEFLLQENQTASVGIIEAWQRLSEEYINNRSGRYLRRLIVFDSTLKKFIQVGNLTGGSEPLTEYNLGRVITAGVEKNYQWLALIQDPYMAEESLVLPLAGSVYSSISGKEAGTIFLAAVPGIITDKFAGFNPPANSRLYFSLGEQYYRIENGHLNLEEFSYRIDDDSGISGSGRAVFYVKDQDGNRCTLIRYPVREGMAFIQILSTAGFFPLRVSWPWLVAGLSALLLLLSFMGWGVNRMTREITGLMEKRIADEKNKRDLEYRMLQSQINPHFLYNTLNSIKWMASIQNASGIVEMTTALSRLLQIISRDSRKMVPLRDELSLLDDYLIIQKYRYGDSVVLEKKVSEESLLNTLIPRFVLQPLTENAIFHGIEPKGTGVITLEVKSASNNVIVSVTDNGIGMSPETIAKFREPKQEEQGMFRELGIQNVDERLRYAFGSCYGLCIESEEGKYTTTILTLPRSIPQND